MVSHVQFPAVDELPASASSRWIRGVLRGDMRFQGAVFADDISMAAARTLPGDIIARAERSLAAGCDVLPVCNDRPAVSKLLDDLDVTPEPASQLRIVRMRGREAPSRTELTSSPAWREAQDLLARCSAAPSLTLSSGVS
jgi:beta-N-acetylhexosaminidase